MTHDAIQIGHTMVLKHERMEDYGLSDALILVNEKKPRPGYAVPYIGGFYRDQQGNEVHGWFKPSDFAREYRMPSVIVPAATTNQQ